MKKKLTTLLFGLLLAVGWTSSAYAQLSPNNIPDAVHNKAYYDALTYKWTDANGKTWESKSTDLATDPYQIYELLRFVYGNPAFPGPKYGAYTSSFVREDPISYDPIQGGWNITAANTANRDITINVTNGYSGWMFIHYYPVLMKSIKVMSGDTEVAKLEYTDGMEQIPDGWTPSGQMSVNADGDLYFDETQTATLTISSSLLTGYNNLTIVIEAKATNASYAGSLSISNQSKTVNQTSYKNYTWNVTLPEEGAFVQGTVQTPYEEGYTALIVSVKDDAKPADESQGAGNSSRNTGSYYSSKQDYVDYIAARIKSVQLLTDGLRIGSVEEHTSGTVFNCAGTYNKFFIISKGQAREKSDMTKYYINRGTYGWYYGEVFPFQTMFEQFSPTTGDKGSQITDFYTQMQDGRVYPVVHDCASVIQEQHQFSMSGNNGTQEYAMDGMNFFIPDYRLLYWYTTDKDYGYTVDGRDMNPYQRANATGKTGRTFDRSNYSWSTYFAQYNPDYAPKVGIYKITLEANAKKAAGYDAEDESKRNYDVTLNWVSSLNEMTGDMVPQTYEIYIVTYNEDGTETQTLLATVQNETTYTYQVPQGEESKSITYIIKGYPTPAAGSQYPSFVAWSNLDDVVIPGLNDFLNLILDHYESDFVIGDAIGTEKNYYRNFLHVAAENEENALTLERIKAGEDHFTLYRYDVAKPEPMIPVGTLNFFRRGQETKYVGYGFTFETGPNAQTVEDYTVGNITNAYAHDKLGMPQNNNGFDLRVKGNGDVVIQPNGYDVNFYEISVYEGNTRKAHWQVSDGALPSTWYVSPGSRWIRDDDTDYYYLEGGGYIAIPDMLSNNQLRVVINASRDESTLGQIKVNDHNVTLNSTSAKNYEWTLTDKYYKYVKVTSASELTAGEYLIVNEGDKVAFDGSKGTLDAAYNNFNVDIVETGSTHEIAESSLVDNATFTIDPQAGTILSASGFYIGWTANSDNGLRQSTNPITNAISVDGMQAHIKTTSTSTVRELRYNSNSGQGGKRFRYYGEGTNQPIQLYKKVEIDKPESDHIVRLGSLPIIDQFAVSVANNEHPNRYGYVLKYEPTADAKGEAAKAKTSSHVEVPVQKTGSAVNGFYTEAQVEQDKDRNTIVVDNISADMQMTLSSTNSAAFYYTILNKKAALPKIDAAQTDYVSNLQNDNFTYQEMLETSPHVGDRYEAGEHHYFDGTPTTGKYGEMGMTYVPFITSRAIERFYFNYDYKHNTYGSPIWATSVGKVALEGTQVERSTVGKGNKGNKWTTWSYTDDDGNTVDCSIHRAAVDAKCYLPSNTVSNVEYEPYMCRIWVKYDNLRNYKPDDVTGLMKDMGKYESDLMWLADVDMTGMPLSDEGYYHVQCGSIGEQDSYANDLIFGADNNSKPEIIVRFYYRAKGISSAEMTLRAANNADAKMYNASEETIAPDPTTAVSELVVNGDVVSKTYINTLGQQSDKAFKGVNIVITRYSDGTVTTTKIVK